ncbi:MAG: sigma 54-interacting transcriptional regulator, partial [Gemmatimonadota bacterium]
IGLAEADSAEELERLEREHGLDEVLSLPPKPDDVVMVLEQQLERFELQLEMDIVGRTEPMREILEKIHLMAPVNSTVLLTGESGTGKELVARAL